MKYTVQDYTKQRLEELNMNQSDLARALNVNRASVCQFLKGQSKIGLGKLFKVIGKPLYLTDATNLEIFSYERIF